MANIYIAAAAAKQRCSQGRRKAKAFKHTARAEMNIRRTFDSQSG